jgi:hypothetical protein
VILLEEEETLEERIEVAAAAAVSVAQEVQRPQFSEKVDSEEKPSL